MNGGPLSKRKKRRRHGPEPERLKVEIDPEEGLRRLLGVPAKSKPPSPSPTEHPHRKPRQT